MPLNRRNFVRHNIAAISIAALTSVAFVRYGSASQNTHITHKIKCQPSSYVDIPVIDILSQIIGQTQSSNALVFWLSSPLYGSIRILNHDMRSLLVRYTAPTTAGFNDSIMFSIRLSDSDVILSLVITVDNLTEIPSPLRTTIVRGASQLTRALGGLSDLGPLQPGDHIICTAGNYDGVFTLNRSGTEANPIFITRAEPTGSVTFTGRINMLGSWNGVHRVRFTANSTAVDISGRGGRVSRCLFQDNKVGTGGIIYLTGDSHPDILIDHNEFRNITGAAIRSEIQDGRRHQNMRILSNHFNGHRVGGEPPPSEANESVIVILTDAFNDINMYIENNLFEGCLSTYYDERELFSIKTAGVQIRGNTVIRCNQGFISLRTTRNCTVEENWFEDGSFIKIHGDGHLIRNNRSSGKIVELHCGNVTFSTPTPPQCQDFRLNGRAPVAHIGRCVGGHPAARNITLDNNVGAIDLAVRAGTKNVSVSGIALRNNNVAARRVTSGWVNVNESGIGRNLTTARRLTAADVGPNAP